MENVIIIGSGPAGLTAAIYAARANLKPLVLTGEPSDEQLPGGQLMWTTDVENYPGFRDPMGGADLMTEISEQARRVGAELLEIDIHEVDLRRRPFTVRSRTQSWESRALIIATGATAKWLGLPAERVLRKHGVSACAICDGRLFRGKNVLVVGGGDTALEEALFLTHHCKSVTVIHRRDSLRASKIMQDRAFRNEKIRFVWDSAIEDIFDPAEGTVTGARLKNLKTGVSTLLPTDGIFVAIGHEPNTAFLKGQVELDSVGYVLLHRGQETSVRGCFAAGDVHDRTYRQAITAAAAGCAAAIEVERYLEMPEAEL